LEDQLEHIPFDQLLAYIFGELPEAINQKIDSIVVNDPYYYDLVQQLMQYAETNQLHNRAQLEAAIQQDKLALFEKIKHRPSPNDQSPKSTPPSKPTSTTRRNILLVLGIILLGILAAYLWKATQNDAPSPPPKRGPMAENPASEKLLLDFWANEKEAIGGAGDKVDWEESFKLQEFPRALNELETSIQNAPREQAQLYYFAGILHLYLEVGDHAKALDYIRRGASYRNDVEYDYSKHLIIALAKNKQFEEAASLLQRFPKYEKDIPAKWLEQINAASK